MLNSGGAEFHSVFLMDDCGKPCFFRSKDDEGNGVMIDKVRAHRKREGKLPGAKRRKEQMQFLLLNYLMFYFGVIRHIYIYMCIFMLFIVVLDIVGINTVFIFINLESFITQKLAIKVWRHFGS